MEFNPSTPPSKHFEAVAARLNQDSLRKFRQNCKLFPNPIQIFDPNGIDVPRDQNFGKHLSENWRKMSTSIIDMLRSQIPPTAKCSILMHRKTGTFIDHIKDYGDDIVIGLRHVMGKNSAHLLFYESQPTTTKFERIVTIIDPNARLNPVYHDELKKYFCGCFIRTRAAWTVNTGEDISKHTQLDALQELGFLDVVDETGIRGYCATIAIFYMISYVCTSQWRSDTSKGHFLRLSRNWLYSIEETETGMTSMEILVRVVVIARYIAYNLAVLIGHVPVSTNLMNIRVNTHVGALVTTRYYVDGKLHLTRRRRAIPMGKVHAPEVLTGTHPLPCNVRKSAK